jgi:uncharacterized protein
MQSDNPSDQTSLVDTVKKIAETYFSGARGSHDWEHTLRVCRLCERIGRAEGVDMYLVRIAAYLHDIGRSHQDVSNGAFCHAERGARMAEAIINELPLSGTRKKNIIHCIQAHRFRGRQKPRTPEAKVLFDADKLDAIGAVGVARAFLFAGEVGARLHNPDVNVEETHPYSKDDTGFREFKLKLCKIKDRILTAEGRRLADERHAFMVAFFLSFLV